MERGMQVQTSVSLRAARTWPTSAPTAHQQTYLCAKTRCHEFLR